MAPPHPRGSSQCGASASSELALPVRRASYYYGDRCAPPHRRRARTPFAMRSPPLASRWASAAECSLGDSSWRRVRGCVDMHAVPQPCCSRAVAGPQPGRLYGLRLAAFCVPDAPEAQGHSPSRATRRLGLSYRAARLGATGLRRPGDGEALPGELRLLRVLRGGRRPGRVSARAPLPRAQGRKERLC